jgi:hypothetical protein
MTMPDAPRDEPDCPERPAGRRPTRIAVKEYAVVAALVGIVTWLGLVGWRKVQEYPARQQTEAKLKAIGVAMSEYYDTNKTFPPRRVWRPWTQRLGHPPSWAPPGCQNNAFSWRWAFFAYAYEDRCLYGVPTIDQTKSWDSPANAHMARVMPQILAPVSVRPLSPGYTYFRMLAGKEAAFDKDEGVRREDLSDPAHTIVVVEAVEPVFWLDPEGLPYDADKPLPPLGGTFRDGFYALFANGSVRFIPHETNESILRAYMTGHMTPEVIRRQGLQEPLP